MSVEKQHMNEHVYVSITGLKVKRFWHMPRFIKHAVASMTQAKSAPGNISAEAKTINGIQHTLSVWETREAMRAFIYSGAHKEAIGAFHAIATGKTFGFEAAADQVPSWDEVHQLWREKGVDY